MDYLKSNLSAMYKFRDGYPAPPGLKAEVAAAELERIRVDRGELTPPVIVEVARDNKNPLHPALEWDDTLAAQKHRERQAASLVRAIILVSEVEDKVTEKHQYVLTAKDEIRQYVPIEMVLADADMFSYALTRLKGVLNGAEKAVNELLQEQNLSQRQRRKIVQVSKHITQAANTVAGI